MEKRTTKRLQEVLEILTNIFPTDNITSITLLTDTCIRYQLDSGKPRTIELELFLSLNK